MFLLRCIAISLVTLAVSPRWAIAQHFTVLQGAGTVVRNGQRYAIGRNSRLYEGDIYQSRQMVVCLDFCAGVLTSRGLINITLLRREAGAIRTFLAFSDYAALKTRPFTNPRSLVQIVDAHTGLGITYPPVRRYSTATPVLEPAPPADLKIISKEEKTYLAIARGQVDTENVGRIVSITQQQASISLKDSPPGVPFTWDSALKIWGVKFDPTPFGLKISAKKNPLNFLQIQGSTQINKKGAKTSESSGIIRYPIPGNQIKITVSDPFGRIRDYYFQRRDRR